MVKQKLTPLFPLLTVSREEGNVNHTLNILELILFSLLIALICEKKKFAKNTYLVPE